jgi:aryl-alcohol dehydrogenase-like predicted oxidoreductase
MRMRRLGDTGLTVSSLGLGTMSFGGSASPATSRRLFERARDAGINLFDCADVYNGGEAESILGDLIADCRDQIVLTSKAYFPTGPDANARGASRYHLVRAVEASLRRLRTDRLDLFFLHRFDDHTPLEETLRALDDLVSAGKLLYLGASNFAAWQVMKANGVAARNGWAPLVAVQPMYNLVKRQAEVELLPMAASEGLGVMTYSPLGGGLLTGKYGVERRPAAGRIVDDAMYGTRYGAARNFEVAQAFTALAVELGHHPVSLAVAWAGGHPAVTAPLLGARDLAQLEPALAAADLHLDADTYARISALSPAPPPATDRNEERTGATYSAALKAGERR